jgi:lysophospholipase L1-like esterase
MKWLKPKECGLSKAAHPVHTHDGGFKINRLPSYWVQKVLRKIAGPAQFPAGLQMSFHTDSTRLVVKYSCGALLGPLSQKIIILVDEYVLEYPVHSGPEPVEFMVNLHFKADRLVRLLFPWGAEMVLYGIGIDDQAALTPEHDKRKAICFCGDSITQGCCASSPAHTYPYLVSQGADMQLINHGYHGLAFPDPALAIYLAKEVTWDILCLAMGVQTYLSGQHAADEFEKLYRVFLEIIRLYKPDKPVFCLSPIWQRDGDGEGKRNAKKGSLPDYRAAIQNAVLNMQTKDRHLYFINGLLLVDSGEDITADGLHPDDAGMKAMAQGILLAFKINGVLK